MKPTSPQLLKKVNERMQTIGNNANPKMSVLVSRAKDTIQDADYWTVETIRTKAGVGDLSVAARRMRPYGPPDRLYNIYVDNGVVKTAIREYPDIKQLKWQYQFDVGPGTACAIAFDGHWELYRGKWRQVTEEKPWLFWIQNGSLFGRIWDDESKIFELATGVSKVKATRGWRNVNFADKDQGLIVGYIKTNGKIYYRGYCSQSDGGFAWEPERELTSFMGTAINLNMFLTNDYRVGFIIENSLGQITWMVTDRNWAGMAIASDKIFARLGSLDVNLYPVTYHLTYHDEYINAKLGTLRLDYLYANSFNEFIFIENMPNDLNNYGIFVNFKSRYGIYNVIPQEFQLIDENGTIFSCLTAMQVQPSQYILEFMDFNNAVGDVTLKFMGNVGLNAAGTRLDPFEGSFTPINLVPTFIPLPEVEVIWNE